MKLSRMRIGLSAALVCGIFTAVWISPSAAQHAHEAKPSAAPSVGAPAIAFDLKSLDGKSVGLTSFRGKPLVLNFFASWCDPCRDEMPLINELASKAAKDGYSVLGIAVEDSRAAVSEFAKEAKLVFPIALDLKQHRETGLSDLRPAGDVLHRRPGRNPRRRARSDHPRAREGSDEENWNEYEKLVVEYDRQIPIETCEKGQFQFPFELAA